MKKVIKIMVLLGVMFCITGILNVNTSATVKKDKDDVKALNKIIKGQKKHGDFYKDLYNKDNYVWDKKTGRLKKIVWKDIPIFGKLNFNEFDDLEYIYLYKSSASDLNISKLKNVKSLICIPYMDPITIKVGSLKKKQNIKSR